MKKEIIVIRSFKDYIESEVTDNDFKDSVVVYCRVSTQNQIEGSSLDFQQNKGIEFFKERTKTLKFNKIIVFREEGESGDDYNSETIVLRNLLRLILIKIDNNLIKHLWVLDNSRLSRNTDLTSVIHKKLRQNKVKFYESGIDRDLNNLTESMFMKILSVFDEYENHKRFQKSIYGKIESLRKNKWIGGTYPFGYKKGNYNGDIKIDRITSKYVRIIFEMCKNGSTTKEIVEYLNKENIKSPKTKSGLWNCQTIRNMLRSTKYIGKHIVSQKLEKNLSKEECFEKGLCVTIETKTPIIISNELFNEVQLIVSKWSTERNKNSKTKHNYLIKDLTYCGHCGNKMKVNFNKQRNWGVYFCDYSSKNWKIDDDRFVKCGKGISKYIHLQKVENLVWEEILKTFKDSDTIKTQYKNSVLPKKIEERNVPKDKIVEYEKLIKKYLKQIRNIKISKINRETDYDLDVITKDEMKNLLLRYDNKVLEIEDSIQSKSKDILEIKKGILWYDWLTDWDKHYNEIKNYNTFEERKGFINKHINKIVIKWNKNNNTHNIIIHFNLKIVGDDRIRKDKYVYELINGKSEKVITYCSHLNTQNLINNYSNLNVGLKPTQQLLTEFESNKISYKNSKLLSDKDIILSFKLNIISSKLTKTTHYTSYQQKLYRLVKFLKEERNISFKGISLILDQKNYKTIRTNKIIKPNNLDSTYRKGKVRENRINRDFESQIEDFEFKILRKN